MAEQSEHRKEESSNKRHLNPALSTRSSKKGPNRQLAQLESHSRGAGPSTSRQNSGAGSSGLTYRTRSRSGTEGNRDSKKLHVTEEPKKSNRPAQTQEPIPSTSRQARTGASKSSRQSRAPPKRPPAAALSEKPATDRKRGRDLESSSLSIDSSDSTSGQHRYPLRNRERSTSSSQSEAPPPKKIVPNKRTKLDTQQPRAQGSSRQRVTAGSGWGANRNSTTTGSCASTSGRRSGRSPKAPLSGGMSSESGGSSGGGASNVPTEQGAHSQPLLGSGSSSLAGGPSTGESGGDSGGGEEGEVGRLQALLEARGLPPHLFGALAPRMQHLLHRGTLPSSTSTKAAQLVSGLQAVGDESAQLQAAIEMCQLLVMGNEDTLAGFPIKQAVPALLSLLNMDHNFDMMNQACRALTYMMEVLPRSSAVIVEAVPVFLEKLQVIQCMDVAEQSLTALEMLSRRHSKQILQARGVSACLMYLDFFSINAQRAALAVTANCCQNLSSNEFALVQESLPLLSQRLQHQDKKSVESVCLAVSRLVDSFQHDPPKLQEIASNGLTANIQQLLVVSPPVISSGTFIMVVRMLSTLCASCPQLAVQLLKENIADTLCYLLVGTSDASSNQVELVSRSPQELYELVCLIGELMPRLPSDGMFSVDWLLTKPPPVTQQDTVHWQWRDDRGLWHPYSTGDSRIIEGAHQTGDDECSLSTVGRMYTIDFHAMQQINEDTGTTRPVQRKLSSGSLLSCNNNSCSTDDRAECLQQEAELASSFIRSVFTVLHEVYSSSAGPAVRHKCLHALLRSVYFASPQLLKDVLKCVEVSCQLAAMLSSSDLKIVVGALQLAEILMQKLPEEFAVHFRREGVMHQINRLCSVESPAASPLKIEPQPLSSSMPTLAAPICTPHTSLFGMPTNHFLLPQHAPPSPDRRGLETDDRSPSPPHVRRISDVLKRKRTPKRASVVSRKVRTEDISPSPSPDPFSRMGPGFVGSRESRSGSSSASSRSKFGGASSKTTSFLANLNPARWGKNSAASPMHDRAYAKDVALLKSSTHPSVSGHREKVKQWIREQAAAFQNRYFATEGGSQHPALSTLNRLTGAINALSDKPGEDMDALNAISSIVSESDISPFEVIHSGLVTALVRYLTNNTDNNRHQRLRTFLHVFLNCPSEFSGIISKLEEGSTVAMSALLTKLHGCVNQLEQFPVKVHDLPAGSTGSRNGTSALKFFNSHQLKCNLVRHSSCRSLRQWKGGPVKIDPLALVQAIERYLVMRGYARQRDDDLDADSEDENSDEDVDDTLAAVIISQTGSRHRLQFLIGDHVLPYNMTVYQAVRQFSAASGTSASAMGSSGSSTAPDHSETDTDSETSLGHHNIWAMTHTIYYRPVPEDDGGSSSKSHTSNTTTSKKGKKTSTKRKDDLWSDGIVPGTVSPLEPYLVPRLPDSVTVQDGSLEVLALLRILHSLNRYWGALYHPQSYQPRLPHTEFINSKLTAKATRQLQDPLVIMTGNLPNWLSQLAYSCPFVFPFETRQMLLYATAWDRDRAVQRLVDSTPELSQPGESTERVTPRLERRKRTVTRTDLLKQAEAVVQELGSSRALLEIQYENEVGTGLGPTLEFFTLVSRELQRADLDLWRGDTVKVTGRKGSTESPTEYVHSPHGLFPIPLPRNAKPALVSRLKSRFKFLGRFMAKALMDSRMLDLPMNPLVYRWLLGGERSLGCADMQWVDPTLARSFFQMLELAGRKARLCESGGSSIQEALSQLLLDGCPVADLGLDLTLPGYPNIELRKGGKDMSVTIENLDDYLKLVAHWTLREGVYRQMEALKEGFESVFPLSHLAMFYPEELDALFCGGQGGWDVKTLMECCRPDHGFTHDSRAVRYLFEILSSYDKEEQRQFLQFVTGSPRLPVGGFKSLSPPLTIVRKTFSGNENPDEFLPSVMTCVNYLKLPDYSSIELMRDKLRIAEQEGQHCFHLS